MSQSVTLNGTSFTIPDVGDEDWGQDVTDYLVAIPGAVLQKSGGAFTLTAEVDFGATYGLKTAYYKSQTANPASAGQVRLAVSDSIKWRNNANGADLTLAVDAADALTFGGNKIVTVAGGFTFVATNTYANQKGIRFSEQTGNGSNYVELVAPDAVTANITLKLPDGVGTAGQVLSTDGSGAMSWINAAGGGTVNTGTQGRLAVYSATGTTIDDVVTMTNTVSVSIAAHGQASVYTIPDSGSATADFVLTAGAQTIAGNKTLSGRLILTAGDTAALTTAANTFKLDTVNALVSIGTATMTYPLYISKSSAGANVTLAVENSESANAASHARLYVITGGASGGDPFATFYNGVTNWSLGLDNSASDNFVLSASAALGTTNILSITTAGAATLTGTLNVGGASATAVLIQASQNNDHLGIFVDNQSNTSGSNARLAARVAGTSAGDPVAWFNVSGATSFTIGIDNSDSDKFKLARSSDLGTSDVFEIDSNSRFWLTAGNLQVSRAASGVNVSAFIINSSTDASSGALLNLEVAGTAAGDPYLLFTVSGGSPASWTIGVDNSDSDKFKINNSTALANGSTLEINASNQILGLLGSVSLPTWSFSSDPNTGMYSSGANVIDFASDGVRLFSISDGGSATPVVGIQGANTCLRIGDGTPSVPAINFNNDLDCGIYRTTANEFRLAAAGAIAAAIGNYGWNLYAGGANVVEVRAGKLISEGAGTVSLGDAAQYFNDVSYKTLTDRGCIPWCDDGVELADGTRVSDLEALCMTKKHATRKTPTGLPRLDYASFPKHAFKNCEAELVGETVERDENGEAWVWRKDIDGNTRKMAAQDGVEMTMLFGVFIGAFKEIKKDYLDVHAARIDSLEKRVEKLEKHAA